MRTIATGRTEFEHVRNQLAFELMYLGGLRCSEVVWLNLEHVAWDTMALVGFRRKGRKYSTKPLHPAQVDLLDRYVVLRARELERHEPGSSSLLHYPLIVSTFRAVVGAAESYRINQKTLWRMVRHRGDEAGVVGARPHRLRHTFAKRHLEATKDLAATAQALDHSDLKQTMRYVTSTLEEQRQRLLLVN